VRYIENNKEIAWNCHLYVVRSVYWECCLYEASPIEADNINKSKYVNVLLTKPY